MQLLQVRLPLTQVQPLEEEELEEVEEELPEEEDEEVEVKQIIFEVKLPREL